MNNGGNFFEKKSFSAVATALTGISRFVTFMSLSEKITIQIKNQSKKYKILYNMVFITILQYGFTFIFYIDL